MPCEVWSYVAPKLSEAGGGSGTDPALSTFGAGTALPTP